MSSLPQHPVTHETPVMVLDDSVPCVHVVAEVLYLEGYNVATRVIPRERAMLQCWHSARTLRQAGHLTISSPILWPSPTLAPRP